MDEMIGVRTRHIIVIVGAKGRLGCDLILSSVKLQLINDSVSLYGYAMVVKTGRVGVIVETDNIENDISIVGMRDDQLIADAQDFRSKPGLNEPMEFLRIRNHRIDVVDRHSADETGDFLETRVYLE